MWAFLTFNHKPEVLTSSLWLGRTTTSNVVIPSGRLLMKLLLRISSLLFILFSWSACSLPPQNCRLCVKQGSVVHFYAGSGTPSFAAPYFQLFLQVQPLTSDSSALCDCCIVLQPHPPNTLKIKECLQKMDECESHPSCLLSLKSHIPSRLTFFRSLPEAFKHFLSFWFLSL